MRVHTDQSIGIGKRLATFSCAKHDLREIFQVDLMADARVRWNDAEIIERLLSPTEKSVAFNVALELDLGILMKCLRRAEVVHLDGVVDDKIAWRKGIDLFRIAAQPLHRRPHGGEIDYRRHAGKILREHSCRHKSDLFFLFGFGLPVGQRRDIVLVHMVAVFASQQVLQQYLERDRQTMEILKAGLF